MDNQNKEQIEVVWRQKTIPVIYRRGGSDPLMVKLPYAEDNRVWVKNNRRNKPSWNAQYECWETPKSWFDDFVSRSLIRYGRVYVIQPYRKQEKCAPACWNAKGHECQCSCMGENHGSQSPNGNWFEVSETFATKWHKKELACRLIERSM